MAASPWGAPQPGMIVSTTTAIDGRPVRDYLGVVTGEVIVGANLFRDIFASITDLVGGRKEALGEMQDQARELGGNAVIGVDIDYEVLGQNGSMLMVSVSGTAVRI